MENINGFAAQASRIREKLEAARWADPDLRVFGARSHKYHLGPPVSPAGMAQLETEYGVDLPADLRAFLTLVGNGGSTNKAGHQCGAGPYYGVYEAEQVLKQASLSAPPLFSPRTTEAEWHALKAQVEAGAIPYEDLTRGCACIVEQGCSFINLLVLCGPETGRVVNFDEDICSPQFAFEANFLDWYERWLDEIIAGYFRSTGLNMFGFTMGGNDRVLLAAFGAAQFQPEKLAAINGFFKLVSIAPESADKLAEIAQAETGALHQRCVEALLNFAPQAARPFLEPLITDPHTDMQTLCQHIGAHAPALAAMFRAPLLIRLAASTEHATFFSILRLLNTHAKMTAGEILPYVAHTSPAFRSSAIYFMGIHASRNAHTAIFVNALRDKSPTVVRNALQAIQGMDDARLRAVLPKIRARFRAEKDSDQTFILVNLTRVEREMLGFKARLKRALNR